MSLSAVLRSTFLFSLFVLLLTGCPKDEGDSDALNDLTEEMCMNTCKSDADCGNAECIATSDGSKVCAAPECRACWAQGANYTCRFDPENGCGFNKCGIVICGPRKTCNQSGGDQCAAGSQCMKTPSGTSICLPATCSSCFSKGQDCSIDSMSCELLSCVPLAPASGSAGSMPSGGSTGSNSGCTCSKPLPQCPAGTPTLASIPGLPVSGKDCCTGNACLGYYPATSACASYCAQTSGMTSGGTSGGTSSGGPSTSGGTSSGGTSSGGTTSSGGSSGGSTSGATYDSGNYSSCISFFYDRDRYNWYSLRNNCTQALHVTYGRILVSGLYATDVAAGGKQSMGWTMEEVTKGGGVRAAVCRVGYIPVLSGSVHWDGKSTTYSCKKQ